MSHFESPRFPENISYLARSNFGPGYKTTIATTASGYETRIASWAQARHAGDMAFGILNQDDLDNLISFYHGALGNAHTWRFKDWNDYKSCKLKNTIAATDQLIGTGDTVETEFQLIKTYDYLNDTVRTIKKPVAGTVKVALNDVEQGSGWSVDTTTGIITFSSPPGAGVTIKAGYEFDVPCRFNLPPDQDGVQRLAFTLIAYQTGSTSVPIIEVRV